MPRSFQTGGPDLAAPWFTRAVSGKAKLTIAAGGCVRDEGDGTCRHPVEKPRIGLVLGAGGVVGQAYHSGVLAALEHDYGWDPRTADVIVGTSAGSITGMLLRSGVPASELAAWTVKAPLTSEGAAAQPAVRRGDPQVRPVRRARRAAQAAVAAGPRDAEPRRPAALAVPAARRVPRPACARSPRHHRAARRARRDRGPALAGAGPVAVRRPAPRRPAGRLRPRRRPRGPAQPRRRRLVRGAGLLPPGPHRRADVRRRRRALADQRRRSCAAARSTWSSSSPPCPALPAA